jgi:hypothetical protein
MIEGMVVHKVTSYVVLSLDTKTQLGFVTRNFVRDGIMQRETDSIIKDIHDKSGTWTAILFDGRVLGTDYETANDAIADVSDCLLGIPE